MQLGKTNPKALGPGSPHCKTLKISAILAQELDPFSGGVSVAVLYDRCRDFQVTEKIICERKAVHFKEDWDIEPAIRADRSRAKSRSGATQKPWA
jgi:hypothetical protein